MQNVLLSLLPPMLSLLAVAAAYGLGRSSANRDRRAGASLESL